MAVKEVLPDFFDPEQNLEIPTPLPLYYIEGMGGFIARHGLVDTATYGAAGLQGRRVREVLREALDQGKKVWRILKHKQEWETVG